MLGLFLAQTDFFQVLVCEPKAMPFFPRTAPMLHASVSFLSLFSPFCPPLRPFSTVLPKFMSQLDSHYPFLVSPDHLSTAGSRISGTHSVLECFINLVYTLTFHPVCKLLTNQTPLPVSLVSSIHGVCEWVGVDMHIRTLKNYTYVSHPISSASPPHVYMDRLFLWHVCFLATVKSKKGEGWEWKQTLKFLPLSLLYKLVLAYKQEVETNFFQFVPWYTYFPFLCLLFNCHCYFGLLASWCRSFLYLLVDFSYQQCSQ